MGANADPTSHNLAPAARFRHRMGFVVMDEAFDEWKQNADLRFKVRPVLRRAERRRDVRDFIRRDRISERHHVEHRSEQRNAQAGEAMARGWHRS
jgi:hypothetical protein